MSDQPRPVDGIVRQAHAEGCTPGRAMVINAAELLATDPEPADPVLGALFDRGDKVAVIGSSKVRKSFFVLQMAAQLASGGKFLNWLIGRPRRVLLIQCEIRGPHFHRRIVVCLG